MGKADFDLASDGLSRILHGACTRFWPVVQSAAPLQQRLRSMDAATGMPFVNVSDRSPRRERATPFLCPAGLRELPLALPCLRVAGESASSARRLAGTA